MADNLLGKYADTDDNNIGPLRFVDIGGVFYAVSILAQADGTLLSTFPISAASLPLPSGASTAALQTTGNAILTTIDADTGNIATSVASVDTKTPSLGQALAAASVPVVLTAAQITTLTPLATVAATQSGTWNVTNVSGTVSLPTGASTLAEQQSQTTHLATIAGDTTAIETAVQLIDDSVVAVDAVGTSAKVLMQGAIRDDALSALTPVEGDAVNLRTDANGALWVIPNGIVDIQGNVNVTPLDGYVFVRPDSTWTVTHDSAHSLNAPGFPHLLRANASAPSDVSASGDAVIGWALLNGSPVCNLAVGGTLVTGSAGLPVAQQGTFTVGLSAAQTLATVTTVGTVTNVATIGTSVTPGTSAAHLGKAEDAAHSSGDTGVFMLAVRSDTAAATGQTDGDYSALVVDSTGRLHVNVGNTITVGSHAVTNAGTFVVQVDGTALTRLTDIETNTDSLAVVGNGAAATALRVSIANDSTGILAGVTTVTTVTTCSTVTTVGTLTGSGVAHDGADSGNPHKIGARATNVDIAAVSATNDRTDLVATLTGKLITHPWSNPENFVSGAITSAMTGTTSTSLIAAPASGLRNYITQITVSNSHATVGTDVIIQDGNGGTTLYTIPAAALYGGAVINFPVPLRQPTTATAIYCANVTTGSSIKVSASGFKAA